MREMQIGEGGLLDGRDLATTFSFLRPNELVWNYVVGNYLKGETPPPFDILYWNVDSTNVPGPMYTWYLRNTYLENQLCQPNALTVCGEKIDLGQIDMPVYCYASREDHIVPLEGAYQSMKRLKKAQRRFVVGASGHIAGVINPAAANKRNYWVGANPANGRYAAKSEDWMASAKEHAGSWWSDWMAWLQTQSGKTVAAPKKAGNAQYQPIEAAPGAYVKKRI
jgi:polyhydroxyalkanoate synthase